MPTFRTNPLHRQIIIQSTVFSITTPRIHRIHYSGPCVKPAILGAVVRIIVIANIPALQAWRGNTVRIVQVLRHPDLRPYRCHLIIFVVTGILHFYIPRFTVITSRRYRRWSCTRSAWATLAKRNFQFCRISEFTRSTDVLNTLIENSVRKRTVVLASQTVGIQFHIGCFDPQRRMAGIRRFVNLRYQAFVTRITNGETNRILHAAQRTAINLA